MKNILFLLLFIQFTACTKAQDKKEKQTLAICTEDKGCTFSEITISASDVDKLLGKNNFWTTASANATLIMVNCKSTKDEKQTLIEIDKSFGGSGKDVVLKKMDLEQYLKGKGCFTCPNETKKFSFFISADDHSGNGYFYLNLKAGEAYMPNEAFHQIYGAEVSGIVVDQFMRNGKMETFTIAEGEKYKQVMPIGTNISAIGADALNEKRFKTDFKKSGNTRKHLNTTNIETEYIGKDSEGKIMSLWTTPSFDVCLPPGKFDAFGFYNLGYISVDGITYLVTEISGSGFQMRLTGIADGTYIFNPVGYKTFNLPGMR